MTLLQPELLAELAAAFPDGVAWRNLADDSDLTLGEWHELSDRLARGLQDSGLTKGDRVALMIGDHEPLEWLVSYMAIHKAGGVAVPLLSRLGPGEVTQILRRADAAIALCSDATDGLRDSVPKVVLDDGERRRELGRAVVPRRE